MKTYPAALEVEKSLLSAMMLRDGAIIPNVAAIVDAEDFYRPDHRQIFRALVAVYNNGTPPNVLLVEDELRRTGELKRLDHMYLLSLVDIEFTTARAESYAKEIREKSQLRRLIEMGEILIDNAYRQETTASELAANFERGMIETFGAGNSSASALSELAMAACQRAFDRRGQQGLTGVTTGLIDLDRVTNGLQKSDLIYLAARPSMGKTALALNIAVNAAKSGKIVMVFSLEMSKAQLSNRALSAESRVPATKITTGDLSDAEINYLVDGLSQLDKRPLYIDDTAGITVADMRAKLLQFKQKRGLDLVVIDYVQLIQGKRAENRVQEVSEISRSLKAMAKSFDVPILALSQLSRAVELRADKHPQLSDLRDSGSLEQDADIVMFLYRDEYYNRDDCENRRLAEVNIAKNRNGATASIRLLFQREIVRFDNLTRDFYEDGND